MHREFRKLLENAKGVSQQIIAINLDIRGFTRFCQGKDSFDVAAYIAKIYMKIIDGYFFDATFYKPTGDGLLIAILCEKKVKATVNKTIDSCLKLLEDFGNLCEKEDLIYFPTPDKMGIGIARGSACCIISANKILDYSGKVLNLASRLMDIARPSGIVFDCSFGFDLLSDENKASFSKDSVYVRGIAEEEPIDIYYSNAHTLIQARYKKPIKDLKWESVLCNISFKNFQLMAPMYQVFLKSKPINEKNVIARITYPMIRSGNVVKGYIRYYYATGEEMAYIEVGGQPAVYFLVPKLAKKLESEGLKEDSEITIEIRYPVD